MNRPQEGQPPRIDPNELLESFSRAARARERSRLLNERLRRGRTSAREHILWTPTPVFDNLNVIANGDHYGLSSTEIFVQDIRNAIRIGRKVVVAVIGPSGVGKSTNIMELAEKFTVDDPMETAYQKPQVAIIPSEAVYNLGKELGAISSKRPHGQYTYDEYNTGSQMMVGATKMALEDNNIVVIDTPSTTGAVLELPDGRVRQFGKNRGTSTVKELAAQSGEDFDIYVLAIVPGPTKIIQTFHLRHLLASMQRTEQITRVYEYLQKELDKAGAPRPGASTFGMFSINAEIDDMLISLYLNEMFSIRSPLRLPASRNYFPTELSHLTEARKEMLGEKFYPMLLRDYFQIPSGNALIVENEVIKPAPGMRLLDRSGRYEYLNFIRNLKESDGRKLLSQ